MWCRALDVNRNWQPVTICNRHDLCSLAAFRLSDLMSPFLAGAKLASINASRTSMPPLALSFKARAVMICHNTRANPLLKAPMTGLERGVSVGKVRPGCTGPQYPQDAVNDGAGLFHGRPRPSDRVLGFGISGSRVFHCSSVKSREWHIACWCVVALYSPQKLLPNAIPS